MGLEAQQQAGRHRSPGRKADGCWPRAEERTLFFWKGRVRSRGAGKGQGKAMSSNFWSSILRSSRKRVGVRMCEEPGQEGRVGVDAWVPATSQPGSLGDQALPLSTLGTHRDPVPAAPSRGTRLQPLETQIRSPPLPQASQVPALHPEPSIRPSLLGDLGVQPQPKGPRHGGGRLRPSPAQPRDPRWYSPISTSHLPSVALVTS